MSKSEDTCGKTFAYMKENTRQGLRSVAADNPRDTTAAGIPLPFLELTDAFTNEILARIELEGGYYRALNLRQYLIESSLPLNADSKRAMFEGARLSPYRLTDAAVQFVLAKYLDNISYQDRNYWDLASVQLFKSVISELGAEQNWPTNERGTAIDAANTESTQRARLVSSITQGRDVFEIYGKRNPGEVSRLIQFRASDLNGATLDKLRELDAAANDVRRQRGMSREDLRQELADRATDARGYERDPQRVDQDVQIKLAEGAGARFTSTGESMGQSAGKMNRMPIATANPFEDSLFRSPATGQEYNKKEVVALASGGDREREIFRRLMHENLLRVNTILAGK